MRQGSAITQIAARPKVYLNLNVLKLFSMEFLFEGLK